MKKISIFRCSGIVTILLLMEISVFLRVFDFGDAYSLPMMAARFVIYSAIAFAFSLFINANQEVIEKIADGNEWTDINYLLFRKRNKGKNNERNHN